MNKKILLFPKCICETISGNIVYTVGRLAFRPGRPMLVEHVNGVYLEYNLLGHVTTPGYGPEFNIAHVWEENPSFTLPLVKEF